jgi:hypothetical protein
MCVRLVRLYRSAGTITAETTAKLYLAGTIIQLESLLPYHIYVLKTQISPSIVESPHKWYSSILPLRPAPVSQCGLRMLEWYE